MKRTQKQSIRKKGGMKRRVGGEWYVNSGSGGRRRHTIKRKPCSPYAKTNAVVPDSCFTKDTLKEIKDAYNSTHMDDPVIGNDPVKIRNQLRKKMQTKYNCVDSYKEELCWMNKLSSGGLPSNVKKRMMKELFVPERPSEWSQKPNAWLSNIDISLVMNQYVIAYPQFEFIGPVSIDFASKKSNTCVDPELCNLSIRKLLHRKKTDIGIVFNLDTHEGPGTHWVSMFMRLSGQSPFMFYFNSTGESEPPEIVALRDKTQADYKMVTGNKLAYYSSTAEHQQSNTECGMYSLVFLVSMLTQEQFSTGEPMTDPQLIAMYSDTHARIPDSTIEQFRHVYFR